MEILTLSYVPQADQCKSHELRVLEIRKSLAEEEMHRPERNASKLSIQNYTDKLRHLQYEVRIQAHETTHGLFVRPHDLQTASDVFKSQ